MNRTLPDETRVPLAILALLKPLNLPFIRVINSGNSNRFAQNFEQKYGKPIQTANQANTANQTGTASKSAVQNQITDRQRMSLYQNTSATLPNLNRLEVDPGFGASPEENPATAFYTNAAVDQLKQQAKAVSSVPIEDAGTEKMDQPAVEGTILFWIMQAIQRRNWALARLEPSALWRGACVRQHRI